MKILVFDKNTSKNKFTNYGYGKVDSVVSCVETEELNGRYDIELIVRVTCKKAKYLNKWAILWVDGQLFRIINKQINTSENTIKVVANHIFYDINAGFVPDTKAMDKTVAEAMYIGLPDDFKAMFEVSSDITKKNNLYFVKNNGVESVFAIIDRWEEGELIRNNFSYSINKAKGKDTGVTFTYKKIQAITVDEDITDVVTRLYPTGKDGISLEEKYIVVPNWSDEDYPPFHITREVKFDKAESTGILRELAIKEANRIGLSRMNIKIDVNELLKIREYSDKPELMNVQVGDIVTVKHPKLDLRVKVKVIKTVRDRKINTLTIELGQPNSSFFASVDNGRVEVPEVDLDGYKEKMFYYSNVKDIVIDKFQGMSQEICKITYGVSELTNLTLMVNIFLDCIEEGRAEVAMLLDNVTQEFIPKVNFEAGKRFLTYSLPIIGVKPNVAHDLVLIMKAEDETNIKIKAGHIHVMLRGQGVAGGNGGELPHANVEEILDMTKYEFESLDTKDIDILISKRIPRRVNVLERFRLEHKVTEAIDVQGSAGVHIISKGYTRPISISDFIIDNEVFEVNDGIVKVKNVEHISTIRESEIILENGIVQEIDLVDRKKWNSIQGGGFIVE